MPDELKTAETSEETSQGNGNADVAEQTADNVNDAEFTDTPEKEVAQPQGKPVQSSEQNAEYARRRREAERQREIQATREKAIIEALDGKNPYTGEKMQDSADVAEWLAMKEIEKAGGDPLTDFSKFQKQKEREKTAKAEESARQTEWFKNDRQDFITKHPDVPLDRLIQNKQFQTFASGKVGAMPLSEIYEDFIGMVGEYEKQAQKIAAQTLANQKASPGALSSPITPPKTFFSRDEVMKMTQEEVSKNYDKIRASMQHWK